MPTAPNTETYTQKAQLSDANPDGITYGQSATDKIAFYGAVPNIQRAPVFTGGFSTASSSWSGTASTSAGSVPPTAALTSSVLSSVGTLYGNWTTGSSAFNASVNGASATASATISATGYTVGTAVTASGSSFNATQAQILSEVVQTLMGLGVWKAT